MGLKEFCEIIFAMTSDEIDDLEFRWQNEDSLKLKELFLQVMKRLGMEPPPNPSE